MPYAEFTLELAESRLGVLTTPGELFPNLSPLPVSAWLSESLSRARRHTANVAEKSRSETLVTPILLTCMDLAEGPLSYFSGQRLDVDPNQDLVGECDFIIARTPPVPRVRAPLLTIVEAKKADIDLGLGQCIAQMVGARLFNERAGTPPHPIYGCVTTGQVWQYLKLDGSEVLLDPELGFIDNLGMILAMLQAMLTPPPPS